MLLFPVDMFISFHYVQEDFFQLMRFDMEISHDHL